MTNGVGVGWGTFWVKVIAPYVAAVKIRPVNVSTIMIVFEILGFGIVLRSPKKGLYYVLINTITLWFTRANRTTTIQQNNQAK